MFNSKCYKKIVLWKLQTDILNSDRTVSKFNPTGTTHPAI